MNETPDAYITRILGCLGGQDPLQVLASTADRLQALVGGRRPDELLRAPDPAHWSTVEILAHLADTEIVSAWRLRSIIASDGVALQAFDQNAWAATFRYRDSDPAVSLRLFDAIRAANLGAAADRRSGAVREPRRPSGTRHRDGRAFDQALRRPRSQPPGANREVAGRLSWRRRCRRITVPAI